MKIPFSPLVDDARGTSGNGVVKKVNGKLIVARKPRRSEKPASPKQIAVQDRFVDANDYVNDVMLTPDLLAQYEKAAETTGKSVYLLCRKDWFKAPRITYPDFTEYDGQVGNAIHFKIRDVINGKKAIVTLYDDDAGTLIEKGMAVQQIEGSSKWTFTATKAVQAGITVAIRIEAYDYPGNMTELTGTKTI
jgi:hypothetical protein